MTRNNFAGHLTAFITLILLAGRLAAQPFAPLDAGATVSGFQDDFNGLTLGAHWIVRGANLYSLSNGVLRVAPPSGDPNHLLYELPGYNSTTQETLARIRIRTFAGSDQYARAGLAVGVTTADSAGLNFCFRDFDGEGQSGRHVSMLDDFRAWGPGFAFAWQTNVWYWMRLRQEPNAPSGGSVNDVFAKIWRADGTVAEPANWQVTWNYTPALRTRTGFAGILASSEFSGTGAASFDVDYFLLKASGLPSIVVTAGATNQIAVTITNQPQSQTVWESAAVTFNVGVQGAPPPGFQWFRNGVAISGATNQSHTIASVGTNDHGAQFRVIAANVVSNVTRYATSSVATLTVIPDTNRPVVVGARSLGLDFVEVFFSERVTLATATNLAHYTLTGTNGSVAWLGATLDTSLTNVVLAVSPLIAHASYTVTVNGVRDVSSAANAVVNGTANFTAVPLAIRITEFLAQNATGLMDEDGARSDWIELQNQTPSAANLLGWRLTDHPLQPAKWVFPSTPLAPATFLTIFASSKDRRTAGQPLHTNFRLNSGSGYLALIRPDGSVAQEFYYGAQREDVSFGISGQTNLFLLTPTPGASNGPGVNGFVADTHFTPRRGFFSNTFSLTITSATPAAEIWFTTDGSAPDVNGPTALRYTNALTVSNTTVVRARAFLTDFAPTDVDTHTYLSAATTARQPANPPGFPGIWEGTAADYEMDRRILTNAPPGYTITNALLSLPAMSLVTSPDDMFGAAQGIYYNSSEKGDDWERAASIELIFPDGAEGFQHGAGVRIHGFSSRDHNFTRKHSFHLNFRNLYGPAKLRYPLFPDTDVNAFDQIVLRASSTDSFPVNDINLGRWDARRATYLRDQWMRDAMRDLGHPTSHGRYVHLWLNGLYWGIYNVAELLGADWAAAYFGGQKEDYDVLKDYLIVDQGDTLAWQNLTTLVQPGVTTEATYQLIQGNDANGARNTNQPVLLNLPAYVDYMMIHINAGAEDWPDNNWWSCRRRTAAGDGFHFVPWDQEISNESTTRTVTAFSQPFQSVNTIDRAGYFYDRLRGYENFRQLFMDRVWFAVTGNGPLAPGPSAARWLARQSEIDRAIVAETARWGDSSHTPASTRSNWLNEMSFVSNYWTVNQARSIQRFQSVNLWPLLGPPAFSRSGGYFTNTLALTLTHTNSAGTVWVTRDGSDPRAATGSPAATAQTYSAPLTLTNATRVRARVRNGTNWSPPMEAVYLPAGELTNLVVTEIYYNPPGAPNVGGEFFEFLELQNRGAFPLDLSGVFSIAGVGFNFTNGARLNAGAHLVLARDAAQFAARFTGVTPHGLFTGKLDNNGEALAFYDPLNGLLFGFSYDDVAPWPVSADGLGDSLQRVRFHTTPGDAGQWIAGPPTPGAASPDLDLDADGLPDSWELAHGLNPGSAIGYDGADGDPDQDGLGNREEYLAGTSPGDAASVLKLSSSLLADGLTLSFSAAPNKSYTVQFAHTVAPDFWSNLTHFPGQATGHVAAVTNSVNAGHRFFRVVTPREP